MSVIEQQIPSGTWTVDPAHSSAAFGVQYGGLGTFTGRFAAIDATLQDGVLEGRVDVTSVDVPDANLTGHLLAPDFFDAEQHPQITFRSSAIRTDADKVFVDGDLTIKGRTERVTAVGSVRGPVEIMGAQKLAFDLAATVDRTTFGLDWNAPLTGGGSMLENDVTLTVNLYLVQA